MRGKAGGDSLDRPYDLNRHHLPHVPFGARLAGALLSAAAARVAVASSAALIGALARWAAASHGLAVLPVVWWWLLLGAVAAAAARTVPSDPQAPLLGALALAICIGGAVAVSAGYLAVCVAPLAAASLAAARSLRDRSASE